MNRVELIIRLVLFMIFGITLYNIFFNKKEGFSNDLDVEKKNKVMKKDNVIREYIVKTLSSKNGRDVFRKYKDVSDYNNREISSRSNFKIKTRGNGNKYSDMKNAYINGVLNFSPDEVQNIMDAVNYLFTKYQGRVPLINEWKFIKLSKNLDWGYPFTIDKYIVLSTEVASGDKIELAKTLFHEQLHIIQREKKGLFRGFYEKYWDFESYNLPGDEWIKEYLVKNPDSDDYYKWKLTDELYMVALPTTYNKHYRFTESVIFLSKSGKIMAKGKMPIVDSLREVVKYTTRFYNVSSLYHPNEIFATLLTEMVFNDLSISEIDHKGLNELFKNLGGDYF